MHSVEDEKWFLLAYLVSFSMFDCPKLSKCCFLTKIISFGGHYFEKWAWQVLDFTYIYGKVCCGR